MNSATPASIPWTDEQKAIIEAPRNARLRVEAGPGTGKTAVACQRVAWLADQGVNPSRIHMISFTRAAVAEIRSRIKAWSENPEISAVKISTIDRQAWMIRHGTGDIDYESLGESYGGSYEEGIQDTIDKLQEGDPILEDYLAATQHLVIDEAQDLMGVRVDFVTTLIDKIPDEAGITVFGDSAQAIYGFTTDVEDRDANPGTFLESYNFEAKNFELKNLTEIHRIKDEDLKVLFSNTRSAAINSSPTEAPEKVIESIKAHSEALEGEIVDSDIGDGNLILSRKRAQSLMMAGFYPELCRLRLSGLPDVIHPWVGAVFHSHMEDSINQADFEGLWDDDVKAIVDGSITVDEAWELLVRTVSSGQPGIVDLTKLRGILSRGRPHIDFCTPYFGGDGPVFGTIHASKGREADRIVVMLPSNYQPYGDEDEASQDLKAREEARVYYVAATRAKKLCWHKVDQSLRGSSSLDSGRVWHTYDPSKVKVQIGQDGDLDASGLVRRAPYCPTKKEASVRHERLICLLVHGIGCGEPVPLKAELESIQVDGKEVWCYRIRMDMDRLKEQLPELHDQLELKQMLGEEKDTVGWLDSKLNRDLFKIFNALESRKDGVPRNPPYRINFLKMVGLQTVAIDPIEAEYLHDPFRASGLFLAPLVFGFPQIWPPKRKN